MLVNRVLTDLRDRYTIKASNLRLRGGIVKIQDQIALNFDEHGKLVIPDETKKYFETQEKETLSSEEENSAFETLVNLLGIVVDNMIHRQKKLCNKRFIARIIEERLKWVSDDFQSIIAEAEEDMEEVLRGNDVWNYLGKTEQKLS